MDTAHPDPLDEELRRIVEGLAEGLFPLAQWIGQKTYRPPEKDLPWRDRKVELSPKDLGVLPFFEGLLRETAGDAALLARWDQVGAQPLKHSPLTDPSGWRAQRGLDAAPTFGITASKNVLTDTEGKPISRARFYGEYWPLLKRVAAARKPRGSEAWQALASELFHDHCPLWPADQALKSSRFIVQFASDILYAMMGMRNPAPAPWRFALLIELGEHRRVGNAYTPGDARKAVRAFEKKLRSFGRRPAGS